MHAYACVCMRLFAFVCVCMRMHAYALEHTLPTMAISNGRLNQQQSPIIHTMNLEKRLNLPLGNIPHGIVAARGDVKLYGPAIASLTAVCSQNLLITDVDIDHNTGQVRDTVSDTIAAQDCVDAVDCFGTKYLAKSLACAKLSITACTALQNIVCGSFSCVKSLHLETLPDFTGPLPIIDSESVTIINCGALKETVITGPKTIHVHVERCNMIKFIYLHHETKPNTKVHVSKCEKLLKVRFIHVTENDQDRKSLSTYHAKNCVLLTSHPMAEITSDLVLADIPVPDKRIKRNVVVKSGTARVERLLRGTKHRNNISVHFAKNAICSKLSIDTSSHNISTDSGVVIQKLVLLGDFQHLESVTFTSHVAPCIRMLSAMRSDISDEQCDNLMSLNPAITIEFRDQITGNKRKAEVTNTEQRKTQKTI